MSKRFKKSCHLAAMFGTAMYVSTRTHIQNNLRQRPLHWSPPPARAMWKNVTSRHVHYCDKILKWQFYRLNLTAECGYDHFITVWHATRNDVILNCKTNETNNVGNIKLPYLKGPSLGIPCTASTEVKLTPRTRTNLNFCFLIWSVNAATIYCCLTTINYFFKRIPFLNKLLL